MKSYEWILPETMANFVQLPLQYRGMCGYTLVEKNGLLLPGLMFFFLHFYTLITLYSIKILTSVTERIIKHLIHLIYFVIHVGSSLCVAHFTI